MTRVIPAVVLAAALVVAGVSSGSYGCTRRAQPGPSDIPKPAPTVVSVTLTGRDVLAPRESTQFTMTAGYSDGSRADVTAQTTWTMASGGGHMWISASGLLTAHWAPDRAPDRVGVIAGEFQGRRETRTITIARTPDTFNLLGLVTFAGAGVPDVRVEVMSGPLAGKLALTDGWGNFTLFDVAGDLELRVSKQGYSEQRHTVVVNAAGQKFDVALDGLGPPVSAAGSYSLTIAASNCDASFPSGLRTRTYTATITQTGAEVLLVVSGGNFRSFDPRFPDLDRLFGTAEPGGLTFFNDPYSDGSNALVERPDEDVTLVFGVDQEIVVLRTTANGFSGTLSGVRAWFRGAVFAAYCGSATISLVRL
jgi:hypothetical protein